MTSKSISDMVHATQLTAKGRLSEAVAILRSSLYGAPTVAPSNVTKPAARANADAPAPGPNKKAQPWGLGSLHPLKAPIQGNVARDRFDVPSGLKPRRSQVTLPEGAQFQDHVFSNAAGKRAFKLYVPSGALVDGMPLIVMLHGCTQSPDDFAAGTRMNSLAEEQKFLVAYPAQALSANASKCWNWFSRADQQRDQGEPSLIAGITRQILGDFNVPQSQVYIAGLSAGGAAAAIMGATYPDLYVAVGVHSGLACGAASDLPSAQMAMRRGGPAERPDVVIHQELSRVIPTIVFHGDRDTTVNPVNSDSVISQAKAGSPLKTAVSEGRSPGGLSFTRTIHFAEDARPLLEQWVIHGAGHAWSGGSTTGSFTEPRGPDASREMIRFFFTQRKDDPSFAS